MLFFFSRINCILERKDLRTQLAISTTEVLKSTIQFRLLESVFYGSTFKTTHFHIICGQTHILLRAKGRDMQICSPRSEQCSAWE
jgi:hypothetical protein